MRVTQTITVGQRGIGKPDYSRKISSSRSGTKAATTILDKASIAASATTVLADCTAVDLSEGPATLALTIEATYDAAATQGIKIHVRATYDGTNYDTEDWDSFTPSFTAGSTIRQTEHYATSPYAIKVLVENLDTAKAVTDVKVIALTRSA